MSITQKHTVTNDNKWRFPEMGVPLDHLFLIGFSTINHPTMATMGHPQETLKQKWEIELQTAIIQKIPQEPRTHCGLRRMTPTTARSVSNVGFFCNGTANIIVHIVGIDDHKKSLLGQKHEYRHLETREIDYHFFGNRKKKKHPLFENKPFFSTSLTTPDAHHW